MVNTAELRQIFPLRGNTLRHVVEGDGRYHRAMTPSEYSILLLMCHVRKLICNYHAIDEHDFLGQYHPYGIPHETMLR